MYVQYIHVHISVCEFSLSLSLSLSLWRSDEFEWLAHCEIEAADHRCCHGDVGRVEEEIVRHQVRGHCELTMM